MDVDCLMLAAGASRRFGDCKLLAEWQGQALISHALGNARQLPLARLLVVTGAYHEILAPLIATQAPEADAVYFANWERGMGASLAFGASLLPGTRPLLVLLADQPLISAADLQLLYQTAQSHPEQIVCASFASTLGPPAIFPSRFKAQLRQLDGDRGAKALLQSPDTLSLPLAAAGIDIDTHTDLFHLTQGHHHDFAHS